MTSFKTTLWLALTALVLFFVVGCQELPTQPSNVDEDNDQTSNTTVIINVGGDDNSNGGGKDDDTGNGPPVTNTAPFINPVPSQSNACGDNVSLALSAQDAEGDNLTWQWAANSAPRNLTLQSTGTSSALISGTISSSSADDSPFLTQVFANDGQLETSTSFVWNVSCDL